MAIIIISFLESFFTQELSDGVSLESEWKQITSSLNVSPHILANLNNVVVWMAYYY